MTLPRLQTGDLCHNTAVRACPGCTLALKWPSKVRICMCTCVLEQLVHVGACAQDRNTHIRGVHTYFTPSTALGTLPLALPQWEP